MKKLVAYLTTGYPNREWTEELIFSLKPYVDILELGVPFSDPVADGPIIEKANNLALQNGVKFKDVLDIAYKSPIDTYLMGYFNSFYNQNMKTLASNLNRFHVKGIIVPDLPYEEANQYKALYRKEQIDLIPFIAPTDNQDRIRTILKGCYSRFIYLVAYAGITGNSKTEALDEVIQHIRETTDKDIFIGFGVNEDSAKEKVIGVDGVIVGSSFVRTILDNQLSYSQRIQKIVQSAKIIKERINE